MNVAEIGLIRHFKVIMPPKKKFMNSAEFTEWAKLYEDCGVSVPDGNSYFDRWSKCICSSSIRARQTAGIIYHGEIIDTPMICEVPIAPIFHINYRLPFIFWLVSGRLAWLLSHKSQQESFQDTLRRIRRFVKELLSHEDATILVVSHGFIMRLISRELLCHGFQGEKIVKPKHGGLYIFTTRKC